MEESSSSDLLFHKPAFKPGWHEDGPPIVSADSHFDLESLLRRLPIDESPPSCPSSRPSTPSHCASSLDIDLFSLSPLTSPDASEDEEDSFSDVPPSGSLTPAHSLPLIVDLNHEPRFSEPNPPHPSPIIDPNTSSSYFAASDVEHAEQAALSDQVLASEGTGVGDSGVVPQPCDHKAHRRALNHQRRNLQRQQRREHTFSHYPPRSNGVKDSAPPIQVALETEKCSKSAAAFVGLNDTSGSKKAFRVEELVGEGSKYNFGYVPWDGKTRRAVSDCRGREVAFLAGCPNEEQWPKLMQQAAEALESGRPRLSLSKKERVHRRGSFPAIPCGVSHGGGSTSPGNLRNNKENAAVVEELCKMDCFRRLAGFATSVMASKAPKLYHYYVDHLARLHDRHPELKRLFPGSVFAAASYNFGPRTACYKHKDFANLPFGLCAVTAFGNFDPRLGGHLVLWECRLVIEFPAGSTILLPSAIIAHSNTAIQKFERRYSFAQYTAGGLFRWIDNDCKLTTDYYSSLSAEELDAVQKADSERWKYGLSLFEQVEPSA